MSADHDDHPRRLQVVPTTVTVGLNTHSPGHAEITGADRHWTWVVIRNDEIHQAGEDSRRYRVILDALDALTQWRDIWQDE